VLMIRQAFSPWLAISSELIMLISSLSGNALDDHGDALTAANTQGDQGIPSAGTL